MIRSFLHTDAGPHTSTGEAPYTLLYGRDPPLPIQKLIKCVVLLKKHQKDKMELKWEPNYRVIKLPSSWSAIVENNISGKTKRCNVGDLKHKHQSEGWELKPDPIGRAARFVNHPDSLPDIDIKPDDPQPPTNNKHPC